MEKGAEKEKQYEIEVFSNGKKVADSQNCESGVWTWGG